MSTVLRLNPGESREDFIARIVASAPPSSAEEMDELRRLLPPVSRPLAAQRRSA